MRRTAEFIAALLLFAALAEGGHWFVHAAAIDVPGPVLGLVAYLLLLATGRAEWTLRPARWLTGLLGALIVPAMVGLALFGDVTLAGGWRLVVALVGGVAVTAVATALLFRAAGGRA